MTNRRTTLDRAPAAPELLIRINRQLDAPLRSQVERELRNAIRTGRLAAGMELPSTRALATDLGLSRGIVVEAYEQLLAEGYLMARRGSATTVAAGRVAAEPAIVERAAKPVEAPVAEPPRYDFRIGRPDTSSFPRRAWHKALRKVLLTGSADALGYPDPHGALPLRVALSTYLNRVRGTSAQADRMLMCNGFTQGFRLVCTVLKQRGAKVVATEDPSHEEQREAIRVAGLKSLAIPVDEKGLIIDKLACTEANAVLVTPAHQFPTGSVPAPERRAALLEWAARRQAYVIEDDYDAEFRFDREPIGSLQGVAPERVVYIGSASKTLAPALRLGWLVAPAALVTELVRAKQKEDRGSPGIEQLAFAEFLEKGELDRHLRRMRLIYRQRRDKLTAALRTHLPKRRVFGIAAGLHLMLELPPDADEQTVVDAAEKLSVSVDGIGGFRVKTNAPPALILGYGALRDSAIAEGVKRLASVIERRR